jgi:hypothetical protein
LNDSHKLWLSKVLTFGQLAKGLSPNVTNSGPGELILLPVIGYIAILLPIQLTQFVIECGSFNHIDFHWERNMEQRMKGILSLMNDDANS